MAEIGSGGGEGAGIEPRRRPASSRRRRALYLSTALAVVLGPGIVPGPARAQSVTGSGDVYGSSSSFPATPLSAWSIPTQSVNVGITASGTLTIQAGGSVTNKSAFVGNVSTGTVTVTGAGSTWTNSSVINIGYGAVPGNPGTGTLTITDGGKVTSGVPGSSNTGTSVSGIVGTFYAGVGTVTVSGTDSAGNASSWINSGQLMVGRYGTGTLTVEGGGIVSNTVGYIGADADSVGTGTGTVNVSGSDGNGHASTWTNSGFLYVGSQGHATLNITDGGKVSSAGSGIAYWTSNDDIGSTGIVTVAGNGSTWTNSGVLYVGAWGTGTLKVEDGGKVSNGEAYIGYYGDYSGDNSATVSGAGSTWENAGDLYVGVFGTGALTVEDGGKVSNDGDAYIGYANTGTATVSGAGSDWTGLGDLYVGYYGSGTLTVEKGAAVSNADAVIGLSADGKVTVSGTGTTWTSNDLYVGYDGDGTLTVADGAEVGAATIDLAEDAGSTGTINIGAAAGDPAAAAGTLDVAGIQFRVGTATLVFNHTGATTFAAALSSTGGGAHALDHDAGTTTLTGDSSGFTGTTTVDGGTLKIAQGGKLGGKGHIGEAAGSDGTVIVTGSGSTWATVGDFDVGGSGTGTLTVEDGGKVDSGGTHTYVGAGAGSTGTVTVSGAGSVWDNDDILHIGSSGNGTLNVTDGGKVTAFYGIVGFGTDSTGTATVSGAGSAWTLGGDLAVASYGTGKMTVDDGGTVSSREGIIAGFDPDAKGTVAVSGAGSTWTNSGTLHVGMEGTGTLTIADGGTVSAGDGAGGAGVVLLGEKDDGKGTLNIGAAIGDPAAAAGTLDAATIRFGDGDGTLVFNHTGAATFDVALSSTGDGTHALDHHAGTTTLTGDSSGFTGTTTVSGGTLLVGDAAGNGRLGGIVAVAAGGTLGGSGTILGATTVDGTLAAGNGLGTLTFADDLMLKAGSTSAFELNSPGIAGGTDNDLVVVNGDLTLAGSLDARVAAAGYYRLFDYDGTLSGTFSGGTVTGTGGFTPVTAAPDVQYGIAHQVNLSVLAGGQTMQFWDGADMTGNGTVDGGAGTWSAAGTNWTGRPGEAGINGTWGGSVGVFAGAAGGTVVVDGTQGFDTLQFSMDGYVLQGGTLAIDVAGGGTLNVDGGVSATVASTIGDGAGSALRKAGGGTLILAGTNAYTGGTSLLGGILSVSADANLGAAGGGLDFDGGTLAVTASFESDRAVTLDAAGTIDVAAAATLGLNGAIGGSGGLVKQGAGTLVLGGANSYGGGTTVAAGTLVGDAGSIRGALANAGSVVFDQAGDAAYAGAVSGYGGTDGTMTKRGAGVLTLAGASSLDWTVEAGGLVAAAERFDGDAAIAGGASFAFDQSTAGAYAGALSGSGAFVKAGSGAVLLTGDSSGFLGTTSVKGGLLTVGQAGAGALGGAIHVESGGTLGGTGDLGTAGKAVTIDAGGVHAPGASQIVLGDYVNHGTLRIGASPDAADRIAVAGGVDIAGATLDLALSPADPASWNIFNGPFTIIEKQSTGAVTGTFGAVTQDLLFLDARLAYDGGDGNDVTLELDRNDVAFADVGRTRNQRATGTAVDTLGNTNSIWRSIALMGDPGVVRRSFDALSGEIHASARTALIEDSRFVRNAINERIRSAFAAPGASPAPVLAFGPEDAPVAVAPDNAGPAFWSYGFGSWGSSNGDGNAASLGRSTGGLLLGADGSVGDWRVGFMTGYSHSRFDARKRSSSGNSDNYHLGIYGGTEWGSLSLRTGLAHTWHRIETSRSVAIPGFSDDLDASYSAGTTQIFGEVGYGIATAGARFEPFANLAYVDLHTDGFTEKGGEAALRGRAGSMDATFATLGLHASTDLHLGAVVATARGTLGWRHAFGDIVPTATQAFAGSAAFTIAGIPIARDSAILDAGLDVALSPRATLGLVYTGQFASGARDNGFKASLAVKF